MSKTLTKPNTTILVKHKSKMKFDIKEKTNTNYFLQLTVVLRKHFDGLMVPTTHDVILRSL